MWLFMKSKTVFGNVSSILPVWTKKSRLYKKKNLFQDMLLFKLVEEKNSEEFLASFWDSHLLVLKFIYFVNFRKNYSKHQKSLV